MVTDKQINDYYTQTNPNMANKHFIKMVTNYHVPPSKKVDPRVHPKENKVGDDSITDYIKTKLNSIKKNKDPKYKNHKGVLFASYDITYGNGSDFRPIMVPVYIKGYENGKYQCVSITNDLSFEASESHLHEKVETTREGIIDQLYYHFLHFIPEETPTGKTLSSILDNRESYGKEMRRIIIPPHKSIEEFTIKAYEASNLVVLKYLEDNMGTKRTWLTRFKSFFNF